MTQELTRHALTNPGPGMPMPDMPAPDMPAPSQPQEMPDVPGEAPMNPPGEAPDAPLEVPETPDRDVPMDAPGREQPFENDDLPRREEPA